jgi:hypothetical protein
MLIDSINPNQPPHENWECFHFNMLHYEAQILLLIKLTDMETGYQVSLTQQHICLYATVLVFLTNYCKSRAIEYSGFSLLNLPESIMADALSALAFQSFSFLNIM